LLANIALHTLDEAWQASGRRLGVLVKYADDLVALCATREQAEEARELVAAVLDPIGLRLHPEKTRIVHLERGAEGFDFLGFHHRMRESWKWRGRWYLQKWPSKRAMAQVKAKIRDRTDRSRVRLPLEWAVEDLNQVLRGWGNYFRYGTSGQKFDHIDSYVNERLAILASAKHGLTGRNWVTRFNREWVDQLGIYRLSGKVTRWPAHASR
jgi:RNA-directed DNA polymerase